MFNEQLYYFYICPVTSPGWGTFRALGEGWTTFIAGRLAEEQHPVVERSLTKCDIKAGWLEVLTERRGADLKAWVLDGRSKAGKWCRSVFKDMKSIPGSRDALPFRV